MRPQISSGLFYVESPFQLIQCLEAVHRFSIENFKIIIRENSSDTNNEQLKEVVQVLNLSNNTFVRCHQRSFRSSFLVFSLIFHSYFYNSIFIGDENSKIFKLAVNFLGKRKVILMDDGVATITPDRRFLKFRRFSIFPLEHNTITNDFRYLYNFIGNRARRSHIIIGMDLISSGICAARDYEHFVKKIAKTIPQGFGPVLYIPHRNETEADVELLANIENIQIQKTQLPIELVGLELDLIPISISAFFSSAIFSMEKIYQESELLIYRIPELRIKKRKKAVNAVYMHIDSKTNINMIDLL